MKFLSASLAFAFASVVTASMVAMAAGGLGPGGVWLALAVGVLTAGWAWRTSGGLSPTPLRFWDFFVLAVFALVSLRAFLWLIYFQGDEILVLSPNNLGDMALHLNLIRFLASGVPFWPDSPILTGVPLTYPLGADLFNSLLEILGVGTARGLIWVGLLGAGLTAFALWRWGGAFTVAAFLFGGGLAGFAFLRTFTLEDFQQALYWKNLFLSMFVTQRGLLFALPAGLLLLTTWRERYLREGRLYVAPSIQLLLYAGMPLFSPHTFLFLSAILLAIFFAAPTFRWELLRFGGLAFVPATLWICLVTGGFSTSSGVRWLPGGILGSGTWGGWLWNFGLMLPLGVLLLLSLGFRPHRETRALAGTAAGIFVVGCLVAFAPWEWDNMKLLMWAWLVMAPALWTELIAPLQVPARAAVCLLLFFSGAVSLLGGLDARHGYPLSKRPELDAWRVALKGIPPEARFAAVPDFNHPLLLLGRPVACGYEGHLWSHGLAYQKKLALLKRALAGEVSWQVAAPALDVQWLALRTEDLPDVHPPGRFPDPARGALYDLRKVSPSPTNAHKPPQKIRPVTLP